MEFKEFILLEVRQHAFERLDRIYKASDNNPDIIPNPNFLYNNIKTRAIEAEKIYNDQYSYAVQLYKFPYIVGERQAFAIGDMSAKNEPSNGNLVVAIIRPDPRGGDSQVITIMFRRSDDLGRLSQPFTPYALGTDKVIRLDQFNSDLTRRSPVKAQQPIFRPVAFKR